MNKGLHSKSHLKFFAYTFVLITSLFTFISCENFLQGEEVKEEITKAIEYNNAQAYTINVEALDGSGKIKTPAAGEVTKKVTDVFTIRFEPAEDYKFIKWEAIVKGMSTGEKASDYIEFENSESQETKVTLKKGSNQVIEIRPVCPPRLTYTFTQGAGDLYPRDTAIELNFNQKLSNCNLNTTPISYITIPNLDEGEDSEKYFKAPVVTDQKIIFRAETKEGTNFIPVPNNSRSVQVRIPKDEVWYVNKDYSEPIEVYLDSDIVVSYLIGTSTSAKTKVKYEVTEKNGQPLGTLKVNGNDNISEGSYSVGETISLRYWIPEGYSFNKWKFMNSKGEEYQAKNLSLSLSEQDSENNPIQLTFTIENQVKDEITIKPEIYDPIVIKFKKDADDTGTFKAGTTQLSLEEQNLGYAIGNEFTLSYKVPAGYFFYGWEYNSIGKKTEIITKDEIKNLGIDIVYDKDGDENGYDKTTRLATAQITIDGYTDKVISIKPVSFPNLEVTKFKLDNADNLYERDSDIVFTFNKTLSVACKDFYTIRIPGLPDGKTTADYFESAVLNGNTLTIKPKKATSSQIIPLLTDGTNTITVSLNAEKLYYEAKTSDGTKVNVGLDSDKTYTYKINSETKEKTKIKVQLEPGNAYGTLKVNNVAREEAFDYSIGNTVSITHTLSKEESVDWKFKNWVLSHSYTNTEGQTQTESIVINNNAQPINYKNLSISSGGTGSATDAPVNGITIVVNDSVDGLITVQPALEYIEDVSVNIAGSHGKFSPKKGEDTYKVGQAQHIEFEPDSDFEFIRWQIINSNTEMELTKNQIDNYINSVDLSNEKIDLKFINVPEDGVAIELKPMIVERPQIISNAPSYSSAGVLRDTTIQVMFDYDMDEDSIYYSEEEIEELSNNGVLYVNMLPPYETGVKVYGYQDDAGNVFFKNISIMNSRNGANLANHFKKPIFENPRTLSIPIKDKEYKKDENGDIQNGSDGKPIVEKDYSLAPGTNVIVTIEKEFFRTIDKKAVSMSQAKKWLYLVNGELDEVIPTFTSIKIFDTAGAAITEDTQPVVTTSNVNTLKYFKGGEFKLALKAHDNVAPSSNFVINLRKIYDSSYNSLTPPENFVQSVEFPMYYGADAVYGDESSNTVNAQLCKLNMDKLTDGIYGLSITVKDSSGNEATAPSDDKLYYFCLDSTPPAIEAPEVTDGDTAKKLVLTWDKSNVTDFKHAVIKWREWNSSTDYTRAELQTGSSYTITGLTEGTHYEIITEYYDYAGNVTTTSVEGGAYTRPAVPKTVNLSENYKTTVTVSGTKPDVGNCTNIRIRYKTSGSSSWTEYPNRITENVGSVTITPQKGTKYDFELCSYDSASDKYSFPYYTTGNTYPSYTTSPGAPSIGSVTSDTNKITINWTKASEGNTSGYIVYLSTSSLFPEGASTKTETITSATTTSYTFNSLISGTQYFYKVLSYFDVQGNSTSAANNSNKYTKCSAVTNLTADAASNSVINISWTKPSGNYSNYKLYYKKHTDSSYSSFVNVNKDAETYSLTDLDGGDSYDIQLYTIGVGSAENNFVQKEDIKTYPNPVLDFSANKVTGSSINYTLTWKKPSSGYYDGYKLYVANSLTALSTATPESIAKTSESSGVVTLNRSVPSNQANSLLYIKVSAYRTVGSQTLETTTEPVCCSLALDPVTSLTAAALSETEIQLNWTNPSGASNFGGIRVYKGSTLLTTLANSATSYKVQGLTVNTRYDFKVVTYQTVAGEERTAEALISRYTHATSVPSFSAEKVGPYNVKLNWSYPETGKYKILHIYRSDKTERIDYWDQRWAGTTSSTYEVPTAGTEYTFRMVTLNGDGVQNTNGQKTVTITTPPAPVTSLSASNHSSYPQTRMNLTWTKPSGNYTGVKVYKKLSSNSSWVLWNTYTGNTTTSCTVTGLSAGNSYDFKVESYLDGVSNVGDTSTATLTSVNTKPYAANSFTLYNRYSTSLKYTWTKPSDGLTGYILYYKKSSDTSYASIKLADSETSYTLTSLTEGTTYNVYLRSYYNTESNYTDTSVNTENTYPGTPGSFSLSSRTSTSLTYSWTKPSGNISGYILYYKKSSDNSYTKKTLGASSTSYTISSLEPGIIYNAYLISYSGTESNYVSTSTITKATNPGTPGSFTVAIADTGTKVSWAAPTNGVTAYYLYYKTSSSSSWSSKYITDTYYTFSNTELTNGIKYDFYVLAYKYINSEYLYSDKTTTKSIYTPPKQLTFSTSPYIYQDDGMGTVTLKWKNTTGRSDVSGINIYIDSATSYTTRTGYANGTEYTATVKIPSYSRGSSHYFRFEPYHSLNSTQTIGPKASYNLYTSSGNLKINGTEYSYSSLVNVITSTAHYTGTSSETNDDGAFFKGREIYLSKYSIGKYEVTQELYSAVMGSNPSYFTSGAAGSEVQQYRPVECVNWYHAIAFCNKLSVLHGLTPCYTVGNITDWANITHSNIPIGSNDTWNKASFDQYANGYHLPTECQFEFAQRGGSYTLYASGNVNNGNTYWNYNYPGSDTLNNVAWTSDNSSGKTHQVGKKTSNILGLYDLSGNVREWLTDWNNDPPSGTYYDPYCGYNTSKYGGYSCTSSGVGTLSRKDGNIVTKGTNWDSTKNGWCDSNGDTHSPTTRDQYTGFRICRNVTY